MTEEQRWPDPVYLTKDHAINMTLRDYFAAKALAACPLHQIEHKADWAYRMADAMLKAREQ